MYGVMCCGPNLCGIVAIFKDKSRAKDYALQKNKEEAFSPSATKDFDGISIAWKMGDGKYSVEKLIFRNFETDIEKIFEWD